MSKSLDTEKSPADTQIEGGGQPLPSNVVPTSPPSAFRELVQIVCNLCALIHNVPETSDGSEELQAFQEVAYDLLQRALALKVRTR